MEYIDLENGYPDNPGIYNVRVIGTNGIPRQEKAKWIEGSGFQLTEGELAPEEYIVE